MADYMDIHPKDGRPLTSSPAAQSLADLRQAHAEWSQETFGDVGPVGPAKHLSKEALEVASNPTDLGEYADCQMLLWDMQRRAKISDEDLADAITVKLAINKSRTWPAPLDGEAREHINE